jgi:hypothetical protein
MKKVAVFVMITLLCFTLHGCKSKAVKETEQAIDAIGIVTLESEAAIRQAQKMYEFLTDGEKVKVSNRMVLADALETYAAAVAAYQEEQLQKQREEIVSIYTALKEAADLLDKQGTDLYEAWRVAIYDSEAEVIGKHIRHIEFSIIINGVCRFSIKHNTIDMTAVNFVVQGVCPLFHLV